MEARVWLDTELPDVRDMSLIGCDIQTGILALLAPFQEILLGQVHCHSLRLALSSSSRLSGVESTSVLGRPVGRTDALPKCPRPVSTGRGHENTPRKEVCYSFTDSFRDCRGQPLRLAPSCC